MTTESNNLSGNNLILPEKTSRNGKKEQPKKEVQTVQKLLKHCKTGDLIQINYPKGVKGDFTFYYVEHHHNQGTEVYKRNDAAKRIPFTFSSNVSVIVYPNGYIGKDEPLPFQKFKRVPLAAVPVDDCFCFGKGKSLMRVVKNDNQTVEYEYKEGFNLEPFTGGGAVRVLHLQERKEVKNV